MKPILIGFVAKAGSGKSSAARYLHDNYDAHHTAFAKAIKVAVRDLFNVPEVWGDTEAKEKFLPKWGMTARQIVCAFGKTMRDTFGKDFWIKICFDELAYARKLRRCREVFIIADTRFVNEMEAIRQSEDFKGILVKLDCVDREEIKGKDDVSETQMDPLHADYYDHVISFSKKDGLPAFHRQLDDLMLKLLDSEDETP